MEIAEIFTIKEHFDRIINIKEVIIPFSFYSSLTNIKISNNVTEIGKNSVPPNCKIVNENDFIQYM